MGLLPRGVAIAVDRQSLERLAAACRRAGIGGSALPLLDDAVAALELMDRGLEESPSPAHEWPAVVDVLGQELVTGLVGVSESSLRRYSAGERQTPDDIALRLHTVALIIGDLAGSYNDYGIRRWFGRRRHRLGDRSPAEVLEGAWGADDPGAEDVRRLSSALLGSPAT